MDPPPPPPPHGSNQNGRSGGLPPGNYDIFVIPPHSSGSGFLYLPSLQTHRNSFLAGVACTATAFLVWSVVVPVVKEWFNSLVNGGGPSVLVLVISVGIGAWAFGKTQGEGSSPATAGPGAGPGAGAAGASTAGAAPQPGPAPAGGSTYVPPNPSTSAPPPPRSSWQRPNPQTAGAGGAAKNSWEKAREETRKKEEERKKAEEAKRRREEAEKERQRQREEKERQRQKEEIEKERQEQREREARERQEREIKLKAERAEKAEQEKKDSEAAAARAKEKVAAKKPPHPTARTETEDDAYSFRPYDRPKRAVPKVGSTASTYSESSYAASQSTARTTPPPSHRGPYSTKDPDKIIIKAVYSFNNAFQRTPVAQLISGQGNVTDGLILRITTEGLFIDDDIRGAPQREWDVKAWTMKMAEVWFPNSIEGLTSLPRWPMMVSFSSFPRSLNGAASERSPTDKQFTGRLKRLSELGYRYIVSVAQKRRLLIVLKITLTPQPFPPVSYTSGIFVFLTDTYSSRVLMML